MEINKNEFRLGNYVQDVVSGEWMIIDELGENIGATVINRDKYPLPDGWQMGPIPLTPEILEKSGFGFLEPSGTFAWKYAPVGVCINVKCEYVHQLQNLYFALTGEELNIKL